MESYIAAFEPSSIPLNSTIWLWSQGTFSVPNITIFTVSLSLVLVTILCSKMHTQQLPNSHLPFSMHLGLFGRDTSTVQPSFKGTEVHIEHMIYCAGGRTCLSFKHSCLFTQPWPVSSERVLRGLSLRNRVYFNPSMCCSMLMPVLVVSWEPSFMENPIGIKGCMNSCLVLGLEPISWGWTANPYISILSRVCYPQTLLASLKKKVTSLFKGKEMVDTHTHGLLCRLWQQNHRKYFWEHRYVLKCFALFCCFVF